jgi:hypothetical protein
MARIFTLIVALWTMILSTPLCVSGIAAHPCETCAAACSHEAACSQDPCSPKVVQNETTHTLLSHVSYDAMPFLHVWIPYVVQAFSLQERVWAEALFLPRHEQPYPIGAFPLLI